MQLRRRELVRFTSWANLYSGCKPWRIRSSNLVSVEAERLTGRSTSDASGQTATVAKMNRDDAIRLTRLDPKRHANRLSLLVNEINHRYVMFAAFYGAAVIDVAKLSRGPRTDDCDVVPGDFCQRLRQFLQPAVIRKTAVVDRRVSAKHEFKRSRWSRLRRWLILVGPVTTQRHCLC